MPSQTVLFSRNYTVYYIAKLSLRF